MSVLGSRWTAGLRSHNCECLQLLFYTGHSLQSTQVVPVYGVGIGICEDPHAQNRVRRQFGAALGPPANRFGTCQANTTHPPQNMSTTGGR